MASSFDLYADSLTAEEFEREFAEAAEYWAEMPDSPLSDDDLKALAAVHGDPDDDTVPPADPDDDPRIPF